MSVVFSILGADKESDEYQSALRLKDKIHKSIDSTVSGEIILYSNVTLYGQDVKDVDLVMIGSLRNYKPSLCFNKLQKHEYETSGELHTIKDKVVIKNFFTVIEIKRHDISGIYLQGTDFYVKYGNNLHCVTSQSIKQKYAMKKFLESSISFSPYITNIIWFTQVFNNEISNLLSNGTKQMPSNVIGSDCNFDNIMQLLVWQKSPSRVNGDYVLESSFFNYTVDQLNSPFSIFKKTKNQMGDLTRKKIELIANKAFRNNLVVDNQDKMLVYRGRAGTGKTIGLIQMAIKIIDEEMARVLMLTYNKALVSDIRRLFALADLPDMFSESCLHVNTLHSYIYKLANKILYNEKLSGDKYLSNYRAVLKELNDFLDDEDSVILIKELTSSDVELNWNYVLIDEGQDWSNLERNVILKLFENNKIIVADGGMQFVRFDENCDWSIVNSRLNIKLKYCLRQKENLVHFINEFSKKMDISGSKILTNNIIPGGKVLISSYSNIYKLHFQEIESLYTNGNVAYDMLYLVPHDLVSKKNDKTKCLMSSDFEQLGIEFWDGTNSEKRDGYSVSDKEVRVLQYDSARGLEAWTVFCVHFDTFIDEKLAIYVDGKADSLLLESQEERKKKYIYNWTMIPLTRAIDTLVIILRDKMSEVGLVLKEISDEFPDVVSWLD